MNWRLIDRGIFPAKSHGQRIIDRGYPLRTAPLIQCCISSLKIVEALHHTLVETIEISLSPAPINKGISVPKILFLIR